MRRVARSLPAMGIIAALLALAGGLPERLPAQNPRGAIRGTVEDSSGAVIPSARVVIRAQATSVEREDSSDARGEFRVEDLLPGAYRMMVSAKGFADAQADVTIVVGVIREIGVTLQAETVRESVSVHAQASSITSETIDTASAVQQGAVSAEDLETIPLGASQLCEHGVSGAGDGAGGAFGSDQGADHGGIVRRQFGVERGAFGGRRRQFGRLHRRISAELIRRTRFRNSRCARRKKMRRRGARRVARW